MRPDSPASVRIGRRRFLVATGALIATAAPTSLVSRAWAANMPKVAAASDLEFALPDIANAFKRDTGHEVKLSFGSSGNFARQIAGGAPFELFLSADENYVAFLQKRGLTEGGGVLYAVGHIALFVPAGAGIKADPTLNDLTQAASDGRLKKLAIANPEHAPYGRAAKEALEKAGIWDQVKGRLVLGENVSQAAQFASSGSAQAGIIPLSLAMAPAMGGRGAFAEIPERFHSPLRQYMVLMKRASKSAREFYRYLQQAPARAVLEAYGFTLPEAEQGQGSGQ
jgi:molybdate transport system substrate-binding protein